ncbi:hypothetical protein [Chitinophaga qingshengii]|uniref:Uncharacterized protein n=1 Tax=Chitinophaga qingshengii TaxID=1569794 RepID=A0ABR7TJH8_9BACT|nr:hypothetical protein [Chitinophaga qingshengii]MBC9929214.1 hypothetical protein [Chitinophaga qingshengii]
MNPPVVAKDFEKFDSVLFSRWYEFNGQGQLVKGVDYNKRYRLHLEEDVC